MSIPTNHRPILVVLITLFIVVSVVFIRPQLKQIPFSWDEPDYVANTELLAYFNYPQVFSPIWQKKWAYDQPHLYHFLCGLYFKMQNHQSLISLLSNHKLGLKFREGQDFGNSSISFNSQLNNHLIGDTDIAEYLPATNLIIQARSLSFIFYLATGVIFIYLLYGYTHPLFGPLLGLAFLFNHFVFSTLLYAQADGLLVLLLILGIIFSLKLINSPRQHLAWEIVLGIVCGLALSTKLNGGISLIIALVAEIFYYFKYRPNSHSSRLLPLFKSVAIITFTTYVVFLLLNPFLYPQPIQNTAFMFSYRYYLGFNQKLPPNVVFASQLLPHFSWAKILIFSQNIFSLLGSTQLVSVLLSVLTIISPSILIWTNSHKKQPDYSVLALSVLILIGLATVWVYIPYNWSRYYLPAQIFSFLSLSLLPKLVAVFLPKSQTKTK